MRRFELHDGTSSKFWQIEQESLRLTVSFGQMGTTGQTRVTAYVGEEKAFDACEKLIKEKLRKGYVEVPVAESATMPAATPPGATAAPFAPGATAPPRVSGIAPLSHASSAGQDLLAQARRTIAELGALEKPADT